MALGGGMFLKKEEDHRSSRAAGRFLSRLEVGTRKEGTIQALMFGSTAVDASCREVLGFRGSGHRLQHGHARSQIFLEVVQEVKFVVFSRFRDPDAVPLLRINLGKEESERNPAVTGMQKAGIQSSGSLGKRAPGVHPRPSTSRKFRLFLST